MADAPSNRPEGREKVCVFIDSNELFVALQSHGQPRLDYKRLKDWLAQQRQVCSLRYYTGEIHQDPSNREGFYRVLRGAGYEIVSIRHSCSHERNSASDPLVSAATRCIMAWDMCDLIYRGHYQTFILVGGAPEWCWVVKRIQERGVEVEVVFCEPNCDSSLKNAATRFRDLKLSSMILADHRSGDGRQEAVRVAV